MEDEFQQAFGNKNDRIVAAALLIKHFMWGIAGTTSLRKQCRQGVEGASAPIATAISAALMTLSVSVASVEDDGRLVSLCADMLYLIKIRMHWR